MRNESFFSAPQLKRDSLGGGADPLREDIPVTARKPLIDRVRLALAHLPRVAERKMFGGITFMVNGKMCISVGRNRLMCRIDPESHERAIERRGAQTVKMKGRAYRGFVHVRAEAVASPRGLNYWVRACLEYNKRAKASR